MNCIQKAVYRIKKARIVGIMVTTSAKSPPVHAQREYRCPEGNSVFANGKNIVQAAGLNIVIPAAAMNKRGAFIGQGLSTTQSGLWELPAPFAGRRWAKALSSAAVRQSEVRLGVSTLRVMASRVGEISSAAQRDTEPAERVSASSPACSASARNAGYNTTSTRAPGVGRQEQRLCDRVLAPPENIVL